MRLLLHLVSFLLLISASSVVVGASNKTKRGLIDSGLLGCEDWKVGWNYTQSQGLRSAFSFTYDYNPTTVCPEMLKQDLENGLLGFVPMLWGAGALHDNITFNNTPAVLLGFNEPNLVGQSNLTPKKAAAYWPSIEQLAKKNGIKRLGSPAAAPCSGGPSVCIDDVLPWFRDFFGNCTDCKVDLITTHFYGCNVTQLSDLIDGLAIYKKPIWLTEFNCGGGSSGVPVPQQMQWMIEAVDFLDNHPLVEHYSWMAGRDNRNAVASLFATYHSGGWTGQGLTELGELYLSLP